MVILLSFLSLLSSPSIGIVNNFSVTTTFHTRYKQERLLFYTDKFINRYMAEGILYSCLEATSRLQSRLTMCVHTRAHSVVAVMPLHKTCTQHRLTPLQL